MANVFVMEKKMYTKPVSKAHEVEVRSMLLDGSDPQGNMSGGGDEVKEQYMYWQE